MEFKHSQQVRDDLHDLRNAVVSASGSRLESVSVRLGTQYPSRSLLLNPAAPTGSIRTVGTRNASLNLTVRNATATGEAADLWNGSTLHYPTGGLVYTPNYNKYDGMSTYYEATVLYGSARSADVMLTGQRIVDGKRITLVTLNGSLSETRSGAVSLDVRPVSASATTVAVENGTENVTVAFPTRLSVERWRVLLDGEFTDQGGHVAGVRSERFGPETRRLFVDLEPGVTYDLQMKKVGLGTRVQPAETGYALPVRGDGTTVPEGGTERLVVEVCDRYNNPASGVVVNASEGNVSDSSVYPNRRKTDADRRAVFRYSAPDDIHGVVQRTDAVNVSYEAADPNVTAFAPLTRVNATFGITVRNADDSGLGGSPGFSSVSASDLPAEAEGDEGGTTHTLSFSPDQTLPDGETVSINLDDAQGVRGGDPDPVDYQNADVDEGSSSLDGGDAAFTTQNPNLATVTYTASGGVSAGTTIEIEVTGIATGDEATDLSVTFDRSDGTSETTTFAVTEDD